MDSIVGRILKNASAKLFNQAVLVVSSFAISIPLARQWGAEAFGRYSFAIAFAEMFTFAFDWGLNWLLNREVARDRENVAEYLSNALGLTLAFSSVTFALLVGIVNVLDQPREVTVAVCLTGMWVFLEVLSVLFIRGTFYAFEKMEYEIPPLLAERLVAVILGLAVVLHNGGLIALMLALVASRVIKLAVCIAIYSRKIGCLDLGFNWACWSVLARSALPFGLNLAFGLVYTKIDITMLSVLRGDEAEIGFYRAARALVGYLPFVAIALTSSLFPMMSEFYASKRESFVQNYRRSIQVLFAIGLPMALGLGLLADRFVLLVYGEEFGPAGVSLRILSLSVILKFLHGTLAMVLTASDKQGHRTAVIGCAALCNVVLNLLLIPWRGYVGASLAVVLTDGLILAVFYVLVSRQVGALPLPAIIGPAMLSGAAMGVYVFLLHRTPLLVLVPSAALVYVAVLYVLGGLPTDELARLTGMSSVRWLR